MIQFHQTPVLLRKLYPSLFWNGATDGNDLFLTFDDGPHPEITPWVLDELDKHKARATFFCVGENLSKYENVAKEVLERKSLIANHTFNHLKGWKTNDLEYLNNVDRCEEELKKLGLKNNVLFRPPYGRIRKSQVNALKDRYQIVMWSHLSWDFDKHLVINRSIKALRKAGPGSVIVFHDSEKSFNNLKKLLPEMLTYWSNAGFEFKVL